MRLQLRWYGDFQKRVLAKLLPLPLQAMGTNYPQQPELLHSPKDLHKLLQGLSAPLRGMVALYTDCFCRGADEKKV